MGVMGVSVPVITICPALSPLPRSASLPATQATALAGWPRAISPLPSAILLPSWVNTTLSPSRSTWLSGCHSPERTTRAEKPLSAKKSG